MMSRMDESRETKPGLGHAGDSVSSGEGIGSKSVDTDNVMGESGPKSVKTAEGESDMASAGANRKEAYEPQREMAEKSAMGRERSIPTRNTMGHGQRETIAKHTI